MRKFLPILIFIFILTGCTSPSKNEYISIVDNVINKESTVLNKAVSGYKYYLPKGILKIDDDGYNQVFYTEDTYIYMYVDLLSYFHKMSINYDDVEVPNYYFEKFNHNGKEGFILINKNNNEIYLEIIYNYAKIEMYTNEYNLSKMIANSIVILSSVKYNDNIIDKLINENYFLSKIEIYNISNPEGSESTFLEALTESAIETENTKLPDEKSVNNELD